ncbi:hypothetical protein L522_3744 [Bordetella bronchiseptica MBORD707]|nr:hypothetical protein L522_3744 [Bordetella bronchiseptica MBORD707]
MRRGRLGGGGLDRGGGLVGGHADCHGGGHGLGLGRLGRRLDVRYARRRVGLLVVGAFDAFGIDRAAVFLAAAATAAATTATLALGIGTRFGAGVGIGVDTVDAVGILGHGSQLIAAGGFGHRQGRGSGGRRRGRRLALFGQGGRHGFGQCRHHVFLLGHGRVGLAFLATATSAAATTTATAAFFAGLGGRGAFLARLAGCLLLLGLLAFGPGFLLATLAAFTALFLASSAAHVMTRVAALGVFAAGLIAAMAVAVRAVAFAAAVLAVVGAPRTVRAALFVFGLGFGLGRLGAAAQPGGQALEPAAQSALGGRRGGRRLGGGGRGHRGGLRGRDALDQRFGARLDLVLARLPGEVGGRGLGQLEAGLGFFQARIVVAQAFDMVVRRLQVLVGNQHQVDLQAGFHLGDVGALFVQQEGGHVDRHLGVHRRGVFLHGFFLQQAQHVQGAGLGVADHAGAVAARAGDVRAFVERRTQPLARQLHQAEARDLAHLDAGAVEMQGIAQALFDGALVLAVLHVDEVDHDQAAKVAQAQLAGHFLGGFQVRAQRGFLDVRTARGAGRVHVHGNQGFSVVDDHRAARGQLYGARVRGFDLVFDLEAREQRDVVAVAFDALDVVRHDHAHEGGGLVGDFVGVDQDFADLGRKIVADRPDDEAGLEVDQDRGGIVARRAVDGGPELQQIGQVPLEFVDVAPDAGGARDDAHALGDIELLHGVAQFLAVLAFDAARYAAAARVVRHQDEVAAGQRDECGQGGALVAALFLLDLDDQLLAFAQGVLDACGAHVHAFLEETARDFLERQEAVAVFAVVDEAGFQAGFDAGDDAFVDVAFALFATGSLDVEIDQFLTVDDCNAQFFLVRRIKQHALHEWCSPLS